jgi:hypothetical protein
MSERRPELASPVGDDPFASLPGGEGAGRGLIDSVGARYGTGPFEDEIRSARQQFDELRGRVFDDDELYQQHMALFLEWYVLERPLLEAGRPPLREALARGSVSADEEALARALARSHRSLFEVVRIRDADLRLYDLIGDSFWLVPLSRPVVGVVRGEVFEARLHAWEGVVRLGSQLFYHPRAAHDLIHQLVRGRAATDRLDASLVFDVAEMRLRYSRFRNIAIDRIYRERDG